MKISRLKNKNIDEKCVVDLWMRLFDIHSDIHSAIYIDIHSAIRYYLIKASSIVCKCLKQDICFPP